MAAFIILLDIDELLDPAQAQGVQVSQAAIQDVKVP